MRKDKQQATELRKSGKSYVEIETLLKIPRSTLSEWFGAQEWSREIRKRLDKAGQEKSRVRIIELDRVRGELLATAYDQARREAVEELEVLKYHPLFIAGLMLYWGEGDRATRGLVRLTNRDPAMLSVFILFLKEVCGIPESAIRAGVLIYPDLDEKECREYWSRETGLPIDNFRKSVRIQGRHETKRLHYGVCNVYTTSTYLKAKILKWLNLFPPDLIDGAYYANIKSAAVMV